MIWTLYITLCLVGLIIFYKTNIPGKSTLILISIAFITLISWSATVGVIIITLMTYWAQTKKWKSWAGISFILASLIGLNYFLIKSPLFKLGLSYYSLQSIGVLLLVVRKAPKNISLSNLFLANTFFPKFISGPILLAKEIKALKVNQTFISENFNYGINRIVFGVFKKLVLADNLSLITQTVFQSANSELKAVTIIIAGLLFTFEMYLNFSAYTDIALGFARLFNLKLKENFNLPLRSRSITEYWRKTHISLIDWFTQNFFYYITFKGRKHPFLSTLLGISVTFILSGVWHGAQNGFLLWGMLNALYLIIEFIGKRKGIKLPAFVSWPFVIVFISFANLFFVAPHLPDAIKYLTALFTAENWVFQWDANVWAILGNGWYLEQQFQLTLIGLLLLIFFLFERKMENLAKSTNISIAFITILVLITFLVGNFNDGADFIYMQF